MRLLIVSYCFPPDMNPRAFRWGGLARHWAEQGHEVDVVCGPGRTEPMPAGLRVHSVGFKLSAALRHSLQPTTVATKLGDPPTDVAPRQKLSVRILKRLRDLTWKQVYWPDYAGMWYFAAKRRVLSLMAERTYDAVVTVSNPFTCHLLGPVVRRRRPRQRWIADIGDPFSIATEVAVNNALLYEGRNQRFERRVLEEADLVTVTNEAMVDDYARAFPEIIDKLRVVPPLLSIDEMARTGDRVFPADGRRRLIFTGRLYRDLRSPAMLLSTFRRLIQLPQHDTLDLHLFGAHEECSAAFVNEQDLIGKRIFLHGMVSRSTAFGALCDADVLVNLGNTTRHQLPSKLVEYVATGKPIVNFMTHDDDDSSARFLAEYPTKMNIFEEPAAESEQLGELSRFIAARHRPVERALSERILKPYLATAVAAAYEAAFGEAAEVETARSL